MARWLGQLCAMGLQLWRRLLLWLQRRTDARRWTQRATAAAPRKAFVQPKPAWVKQEVIRLKALMPQVGCRTIAHHFNRRWRARRQMTVSKTYVADTCRKEQYRILHARRRLKHRVPRPMRKNRVWGCDLLAKTDSEGRTHLALA
ncbi:MAG: integrase, partial [Nitrospira sp.]|nr:integrase [Nitrospira sp.]